ncbi:hypothetical protein MKW92_006957, partial [Papaver armeniacum]
MEGSENLLKAIHEDDSLEDYQDADMLDSETLEEGECRIQIGSLQLTETSKSEEGECTGKIGDLGLTEMGSRGDVIVFVIDTCKRLKERKTYLVWNTMGVLGVSALSDIVNESTLWSLNENR